MLSVSIVLVLYLVLDLSLFDNEKVIFKQTILVVVLRTVFKIVIKCYKDKINKILIYNQ